MRAARVLPLVVLLLVSACTGADRIRSPATPAATTGALAPPVSSPAFSPSPTASPQAFLPAPDERIPTDPRRLADALVDVTTAFGPRWIGGGTREG